MMSFLAPFVLFSLLLATRVDTCSVVIFFFLIYLFVNHKRFLRLDTLSVQDMMRLLCFLTQNGARTIFGYRSGVKLSPLKPSSTKIISTDHISHSIFV